MSAPKVRLRHPETGGEFDAPAAAVDTYGRAGWVRADQPEPSAPELLAALPAADTPATVTGQDEPVPTDRPAPRRRTIKED